MPNPTPRPAEEQLRHMGFTNIKTVTATQEGQRMYVDLDGVKTRINARMVHSLMTYSAPVRYYPMKDMVLLLETPKRVINRGPGSSGRNMTDDQVRELRRLQATQYHKGLLRELSQEYGVSYTSIHRAARCESYQHVKTEWDGIIDGGKR